MDIRFKNRTDAQLFYEYCFKERQPKLHGWNEDKTGFTVGVTKTATTDHVTALAAGCAHVFMCTRLAQRTKHILRAVYHYKEVEERRQIAMFMVDYFYNQDVLIDELTYEHNPYERLREAFINRLYDQFEVEINFETLIQLVEEQLVDTYIEFIGRGIEEWKKEIEQQYAIARLRDEARVCKRIGADIHLIKNIYYSEQGERWTKLGLHKKPSYLAPAHSHLELGDCPLAPLFLLQPRKIYIYSSQEDDSQTVLISSVFEERVHVLPLDYFPFQHAYK